MTKARYRQAGMSIVEVLTAVAVISIMSLSVAYFSNTRTQSSQGESLDAFNCQVQVNSVLANFRGEGQAASMLYYYPHLAWNHPTTGLPSNNAENDYAVEVADVWKGGAPGFMPPDFNQSGRKLVVIDQTDPAKPLTVNMAPIQRSAVYLLEELYNSHPALCTAENGSTTDELKRIADAYSHMAKRPADDDSARSIAQATFQQDAETLFKIVPYNIATGRLLSTCPPNIGAVPMGVNSAKVAFDNTGGGNNLIQPRSDDNLHIGYQLEVSTVVTSRSTGQVVGRCAGSQRFEYQRDTVTPTKPQIHAVITNTTLGNFNQVGASAQNRRESPDFAPGFDAGETSRNRFEVAFRFRDLKRGNIMICRDRSRIPTLHPLAVPNAAQCMGAALSNGSIVRNGPGPQRYSVSKTQAPPIMSPSTSGGYQLMSDSSLADAAWKPCDQVSICGSKPVASRVVGAGTTTPLSTSAAVRAAMALDVNKDGRIDEFTFINQYENLRPECVANVEIAVTDSAGNLEIAGSTIQSNELLNLQKHPEEAKINGSVLQSMTNNLSADDQLTEVARPMCGNWCAASKNAMDVYFPGLADATGAGGYWQLGACCVTIPAGVAYGEAALEGPGGLATTQAYNLKYACQPGFQGSMGFTLGEVPPEPDLNVVRAFAVSTDRHSDFPIPAVSALDETRFVSDYVRAGGGRPPESILLSILP